MTYIATGEMTDYRSLGFGPNEADPALIDMDDPGPSPVLLALDAITGAAGNVIESITNAITPGPSTPAAPGRSGPSTPAAPGQSVFDVLTRNRPVASPQHSGVPQQNNTMKYLLIGGAALLGGYLLLRRQ